MSFALGAFFAGMILSESALSQQAASETLPLRDAFAVLFFISVGMLFDPAILVRDPLPVLATVAIIVIAKSRRRARHRAAVRPPARHRRHHRRQSGADRRVLVHPRRPRRIARPACRSVGRELILAGAIISIVLNPLLFMALDRLRPWLD